MRVAICDDEEIYLNNITDLVIRTCPNTDKLSVKTFRSGEEFIDNFHSGDYDIIMLDIEMNKLTGLETAERVRKTDSKVLIVFLTSHQEFATQGYEVDAFRYMLKSQPEYIYIKQLQSIYEEYQQTHFSIPIHANNAVYNVAVSDIIYFEIIKRTVILHTVANNYQYYGKLSEVEKESRLINFVKPHKSYYINLAYIDSINTNEIVMKNNDKIPLSRNLKQSVTDKFVNFLMGKC